MKLAYPIETPECSAPLMAMQGDFAANAQLLSQIGYRAVELVIRDAQELEKTNYREILWGNGLSAAAISTAAIAKEDGLFLLHSDSEKAALAYRRAVDLLPLARDLGCPVLIGKFRGEVSRLPGTTEDNLRDCLSVLCQEAAEYGVQILLEPQNRTNINNLNTVEQALALLESVNMDNFGLHLDTYHMDITETDQAASILRCRKWVGFVHISDSDRKQLGQGTIDIAGVVRSLSQIGYDGYLSPEIKQTPSSAVVAREYFDRMQKYLD